MLFPDSAPDARPLLLVAMKLCRILMEGRKGQEAD